MLKNTQNHESKALTTGQQATLQVPTGGKIQSLFLLFTTGAGAPNTEAQIRAEVGNIRVTFNGKDIINATAAQLLDLYETLGNNVFNAAAIPAGAMELNIGRLVFNSPEVKDLMGLGTADIANIQVQVTMLTVAEVDNVQAVSARTPENQNLGAHCKFLNYPISFNGTGDHTVDTLPRDKDSAYLALMVNEGAAGVATHSEVRVNNFTIRERLSIAVNAVLLSEAKYAQPANYFVHGFMDGSLDGRLPMTGVTDLRCITTFTTAPGAGGYNIGTLTLVTPQNNA